MPTPDRPNILFYCTDQQRFDTIGALGNPHVRTPHLDRFVQEGTAFTNTYCQSPICTPSRSSFMTGLYPSKLRNTRNGNGTFPADAPPLISKLLADSGYDCGNIGKFHLQSSGKRTEPRLDDGYRYWQFSHAPRDDWEEGHHYAEWVREQGGDLNALRLSEERVPTELHQTTWATEKALEFINDSAARPNREPWFLTMNVYDPHPPFVPPKSYADQFNPADMPGPHFKESDLETQKALSGIDFQDEIRTPEEHEAKEKQALYYAMIAQIDDQFARLLEGLEAAGQRDNTVIIFTSDHGETLGDHGLMYKGCRFYEGLIKVPLIISAPGRFQSGQQASGLVELLDVSATVLDVAGLDLPDYFQGNTLRPVLEGQEDGSELRKSARCEYFDSLDSHFTGGPGAFATMYRRGPWKLSVYHGFGLGELYNLDDDPWEHENLWAAPSAQEIRNELILESFDQHVLLTTDVGSERIAPM